MGINRLDNETHVYTEKSARFIYGHGKHNQAWQAQTDIEDYYSVENNLPLIYGFLCFFVSFLFEQFI